MIPVAFVLLGIAATGFLAWLVMGPSLTDRVVAVDGLLVIVVAGLALDAARTGRDWFIDVAILVGLLGFIGTGVAARLIERRGG